MSKLNNVFLLFFILLEIPLYSSDFESRLDEDGSFLNRIRISVKNGKAGIVSSVGEEGIDFVEPWFSSSSFAAGRLLLKGLLREHYNHDGVSAGSDVQTENGTIVSTSSFGRSSRAGAAVKTPGGSALWAFRTNGGDLSFGAAKTGLPLWRGSEADILITAGSLPETVPGSAFSNYSVMPQQWAANPAAEFRFSAGTSDRGGLDRSSGGLHAAASVLVGTSFPQYTLPGASIRIFAATGTGSAGLRGLFRCNSPDYIDAGGGRARELLAAGCKGRLSAGPMLLEASYSKSIYYPAPKPASYYPQSEEIGASIEFSAAAGRLEAEMNIEAVWASAYDSRGIRDSSAVFDAVLRISFGDIIKVRADYEGRFSGAESPEPEYEDGWSAGAGFTGGIITAGTAFEFGDGVGWKADIQIDAEDAEIFLVCGTTVAGRAVFSAGFRSEW